MLLIHRRKPPHAGLWDAIGGKLEPGEDPFTACIREVQEETGLTISAPRLCMLLVVTVKSSDALLPIFVFSAEAPRGELTPSAEGDLAWVEIDKIYSLPVILDLPMQLSYLDRETVTVIRTEYETDDASSAARTEVLGVNGGL